MGNAISFRLNPKNENDRKILEWLDMKSRLTGYKNQTELIKNAILSAIENERKGERERSIESWISEAILLSRKEYMEIVKESTQNVANNVFAGVLAAMSNQLSAGVMSMDATQMAGTNGLALQMQNIASSSIGVNPWRNGAVSQAETESINKELEADTMTQMDNSTKSKLGSLFDMDDD